jgi:transcription initiation factor IIE alpha subunit
MNDNEIRTFRVEELKDVIKNVIGEQGMPEDEAEMMARHVMNLFGFNNRILDNMLEPQDRDVFYMLEDEEILTTEREETTLYDGREWRIHYWTFRKDRIQEILEGKHEEKDDGYPEIEDANIYDEVPEDIWLRRGDEEEED